MVEAQQGIAQQTESRCINTVLEEEREVDAHTGGQGKYFDGFLLLRNALYQLNMAMSTPKLPVKSSRLSSSSAGGGY